MRGAELVDADGSRPAPTTNARGAASAFFGRADLVAVVGLVAFPTLLYALPALFGHPLMPGDDLVQNYPLRVLSGQLLGDGHLPLWNRLIWSGTPLLGGFNAGALYPGTLLFAALNPIAAWVLNQIAVFAVCGVGMYLLFRNHRLVPLAAAIGSVSFTFAGFMQAQLVHFGLVQGMSWTPWMLLAIDRLAAGPEHRLGWSALLGAAAGLVILSGEPRAMANVAVIVLVYGAVALWRSGYRRQLVVAAVSALSLGFALGAIQLLPGLEFLSVSQRNHSGFSWYAFGSLRQSQLTLSVVPYLIGGYNDLGFLPNFAGKGYHLDEVTGYVGLLALVALCTFPFWMRAKYDRVWAWVAMVGVGLLLALGGSTPLGRLFAHIPLFGRQRLQSRNLGIVDLGLAGLVACWADSVLSSERDSRPHRRRILERAFALLPTATVVLLVAMAAFWADSLQSFLNVTPTRADLFGQLRWYLIVALIVAVAIGAFAVAYRALQPRHRAVLLVLLVVADLGLALVNQEVGPVDSSFLASSASDTAPLAARLRNGGRFAVYDPGGRVPITPGSLALALRPDVPILRNLPSVQGYGSIVDATYSAETGTHTIRVVNLDTLSGTDADDLGLRVLLVPPSYVEAPTTPAANPNRSVDPRLLAALAPPHWRRSGRIGDFLVYTNTRARERAWLRRIPGAGGGPVSGTVSVEHVGPQDEETDRVRSSGPAQLVRSVAYADGWTAELHRADGSVRSVSARRLGLVQSVAVPGGDTTVTWTYDAPGFNAGFALTLLATVVLLGVGGVVAVHRFRRTRHAGESP